MKAGIGYFVAITTALIVLLAAVSAVALDASTKCESFKVKEAGKYAFCRLAAESKAIKKGLTSADYSRCVTRFSDKWGKAELKGAGQCPTTGDIADIGSRTVEHTSTIASCLSGGSCPFGCELPATGQQACWDGSGLSIPCAGTGQDGEPQAGAGLSYVDNGDGTILDANTGLVWEKKSDDGGLHDKDLTYPWTTAISPNIWDWIAQLNNSCANDETVDCTVGGDADCTAVGGACGFAGFRDWRVANRRELDSIINIGVSGPAVDPAFNNNCAPACTVTDCSCTGANFTWTSSTYEPTPTLGWAINANDGSITVGGKTNGLRVRAVRSGS